MVADVVASSVELAAELRRQGYDIERAGVDRALLRRLADAGLMAVYGPPELGGVGPVEQRLVSEALAGASPDAWFVWFQHGPVVRMLQQSDNTALVERHLAPLCRGDELGGVAWSHLRSPAPSMTATRVDGGWELTGRQPWCTGWGLVDVVTIGAHDPDGDQVVFGLVPAGDRPELRGLGELALAAVGSTSTHALVVDRLLVRDDEVLLVADRGEWRAMDEARNTNVQPSTFGVAQAALDLLAERAPDVAARLREAIDEVRAQAYRLLDEVPAAEQLEERLALRARALLLAVEAATAAVVSRGGQGIALADPAQRLLRAAAFQLVHSQNGAVREATLAAMVA